MPAKKIGAGSPRAITQAEATGDLSLSGIPKAELLAKGARADVVSSVEHALQEGAMKSDAPFLAGIEALETMLTQHADDPVISTVVALAHMGYRLDLAVQRRNLQKEKY